MHIDHSKLVELLADALGQSTDSIEKKLSDLVNEIQEAISEGDAYEVDGLGVFTGFGNNIIFMPNDDLATEINYKYAGMEALELDAPSGDEEEETDNDEVDLTSKQEDNDDIAEPTAEEDPFSGLLGDEDAESSEEADSSFELDTESSDKDLDDPFDIAGKDYADGDDEDQEENIKPGPDKWGIDTYKDDSVERTFSGLLGDSVDEKSDDSEDEKISDEFDSIFSGDDDEESIEEEMDVPQDELSDEEMESAEEDLKAIFEEGEEDLDEAPPFELDDEKKSAADEADDDQHHELEDEDPFESLAGEEEEEEDIPESLSSETEQEKDEEEEMVPVIKNIGSEGAKKKAPKEQTAGKRSTVKEPSASTPPVMLWVLLLIILLAGGTYGLGYFGLINIPGVTPETTVASSQPPAQPEQAEQTTQPEEQVTETPTQETESQPEEQTPSSEEQPTDTEVSENEGVPSDQSKYGLMGKTVEAANDGYTIVVFSLSKEGSAQAKQQQLRQAGYRALLASRPSQQYGQLWRVSLGQFESLRTAALAAEELEAPYSENYFITKIQ